MPHLNVLSSVQVASKLRPTIFVVYRLVLFLKHGLFEVSSRLGNFQRPGILVTLLEIVWTLTRASGHYTTAQSEYGPDIYVCKDSI